MPQKIIITGAMGSGKSTLLNQLNKMGYRIFAEPARKILAEQRTIGGHGVPETNPYLFTHLLLSRSMNLYYQADKINSMVLFDRGVADNLAYAKLFNLDTQPFEEAALRLKFNSNCFFLPAWEEIYTTDDERKMSYAQAHEFGDDIKHIYQKLAYNLIEVPKTSAEERADFVIKALNQLS